MAYERALAPARRRAAHLVTLLLGGCAAALLGGLSALHVYWAVRGGSSLGAVVPEVNGAPAFRPTKAATLAVAAALGAGSLLVVGALGGPGLVPVVLARGGCAVMALVFAARTVGDFKHVGAFKRRRGTRFAYWDDRIYTPISAGLAIATAVVAIG